jgi:hypothetical protein
MRCEQVRDQLADLVIGDAAPRDDAAVREHLQACAACRREAAALTRLWEGLEAIPAPPPDSAAMRARFTAMLDGYEHGRDGASAAARWDRVNTWLARWWPAQPLAQLAGAVALVALGAIAGRATRPAAPPPPDQMAALRTELREMRQMVMLSLMQQQSASDRLKGVSWSEQLEEPGSEVVNALLDALLHDPHVNVRLAAVEALGRFADQQRVRQGAIDALGAASPPLVQIALIDFVVGVQEKASIDTLKKLASDPALHETVRDRARWGLERLGVRS